MSYRHIPAMLNEVVNYLNCRPGSVYVDGTLGGCGHARAICEKISPGGTLIGIDQDIDAISNAETVLKKYSSSIHLFHGNFDLLPEFLKQLEIDAVDGILLDLGLSQHQIEDSGRGFSFRKDEPLDMRMDIQSRQTAEQLVNNLSQQELQKLFREYGEERRAKQIAKNIARIRHREKIRTSKQLAQIIIDSIPAKAASKQKIHPATRVFMALRIAVNRELERLETFLEQAVDSLKPGGRLCVLSFHSLEDRIVKQRIKALEKGCTCAPQLPQCVCGQKPQLRILTKRVARPTEEEIAANPMARSTRLRAAEKL
ncbi:MAG: 16S rRNA (cytosine(1402)-N(4))-methyltransferase RsmH [Desulfobacterales bacterium]